MIKRALGSTGLDVSVLGLGTVKIGRNQQVKYPSEFELPDDKSVVELFELAQSLGINFIDTAPAYGSSEQRLGKLLPDRHDWVIMTKVGEIFEGTESRFDFSFDYTIKSVEKSLKTLKRDVLDVVQNAEAVLRSPRQRLQDKHVERSLEHWYSFRLCGHGPLEMVWLAGVIVHP